MRFSQMKKFVKYGAESTLKMLFYIKTLAAHFEAAGFPILEISNCVYVNLKKIINSKKIFKYLCAMQFKQKR